MNKLKFRCKIKHNHKNKKNNSNASNCLLFIINNFFFFKKKKILNLLKEKNLMKIYNKIH